MRGESATIPRLSAGMAAAASAGKGEVDNAALARLFSAYTIAATLWLLFATGVGILLAFKLGAPDFGSGAWLTFGRLRPIHTNATFYGWASVALVGLAYYVAARSSRICLYSAKLGWLGLALFNVAAVALFVVAWAVWYAARMWDVPAELSQTPTYSEKTGTPTTK